MGGFHQQDFSRAQTLPFNDVFSFPIGEARLRPGHEQTVRGQGVTKRAEPVAVEFGSDQTPVGKRQGSRTIPGFLLGRCGLEKSPQTGWHFRVGFPRGRHEPEHGRSQAFPLEQSDFQGVVEAGGIANVVLERAKPRSHAQVFPQSPFARARPAAVRDDGVDLPVVRRATKRLGQRPGGPRVGRVALMENGERGHESRTGQIGIEGRELPGGQQALVNHRSGREGTEIGAAGSLGFDPFSQKNQRALEAPSGSQGGKKELPDDRERGRSPRSQDRRIGGHGAPAQDLQSRAAGGRLNRLAGRAGVLGRQEGHAQPESSRQGDPRLRGAIAEKLRGDGSQQTGAVAAQAVGIHAAAVREPQERRERAVHHLAAAGAPELRHESNAAGIVVHRRAAGTNAHSPIPYLFGSWSVQLIIWIRPMSFLSGAVSGSAKSQCWGLIDAPPARGPRPRAACVSPDGRLFFWTCSANRL